MAEVQKIGADSAQVGKDLNALIFSSGSRSRSSRRSSTACARRRARRSQRAEDLDAPGPLRMQHQDLIKALQLRVSGLNGLLERVRQSPAPRTRTRPGRCSRSSRGG